MKLEQSFEVKAPLQRVWETLIDVQRVAPCLPGAEVTAVEDAVYKGNFTVKVGPTTAAYRGELRIDALDESAHRATMHASGTDKRGQGGARASMVSTLSEIDGGTRVDVATDFTITGRLARFGRGGMIQDVSQRLLRDFADCLRSQLEADNSASPSAPGAEAGAGEAPAATGADRPAPPQGRPIKGLTLLFSVLWQRIRRLVRRRS